MRRLILCLSFLAVFFLFSVSMAEEASVISSDEMDNAIQKNNTKEIILNALYIMNDTGNAGINYRPSDGESYYVRLSSNTGYQNAAILGMELMREDASSIALSPDSLLSLLHRAGDYTGHRLNQSFYNMDVLNSVFGKLPGDSTMHVIASLDVASAPEQAENTVSSEDPKHIHFFTYVYPDGTWLDDELFVMAETSSDTSARYVLIPWQNTVYAIVHDLTQLNLLQDNAVLSWLDRHSEYLEQDSLPVDLNQVKAGNITASAITQSVRIHADGAVNVRSEADAKSAKVGSAKASGTYPVLSIAENGWFEITLEDGTIGYVSPKVADLVQ